MIISHPAVYGNFVSESSTDAENFEATNLDLSSTNHLRFRVRGDNEALMALTSQSGEVSFYIALASGSSQDVSITSETDYDSITLNVPIMADDTYSEFWLKWNEYQV